MINLLKNKNASAIMPFIFAWFIISSCSPTKKLSEKEYLINDYKVTFKDKNTYKNITKSEIEDVLYPYTNRKIFGFYRFYLQMYYLGDTKNLDAKINLKKQELYSKNKYKKEKYDFKRKKFEEKLLTKNDKRNLKNKLPKEKYYKKFKPKQYKPTFNQWLTEIVGEKPILSDSISVEKNKLKINNLLFTKGYFNSTTNYSIDTFKKKVNINYSIIKKTPYKIDSIYYTISDNNIKQRIDAIKNKSLIKKGKIYNKDDFENERIRITEYLKNEGYFKFNKNYITYNIDSTVKDHKLNVKLIINDFIINKDSTEIIHPIYKIKSLNIYVDCNIEDSLLTEQITKDKFNTYHIFHKGKLDYSPKLLMSKIFINSTKNFNYKQIINTYRTLNALGVFKRIEILPKELNEGNHLLKIDIILESKKKNIYSIETNGTVRDGGLGANVAFSLNNHNLFKGAEILQFKISAGIEAVRTITDTEEDNNGGFSPNTIEISPELSLIFPKFLLPFKLNKLKKQISPKTMLTLLYNYQDRTDYKRTLSSGFISYQWNQNNHFKHQFTPINVSYINIEKSASFEEFLKTINDPLIVSSYQDNLIPSTSYSLYYLSNETFKEKRHNWYNYSNIELAGIMITNLAKSFNLKQDTSGSYLINKVPIANFFKLNDDLRYHFNYDDKNKYAFRFSFGFALPLKNSEVIPFEKAFTAGGANDIRAWQARTLGPGAYTDTIRQYDKLGDIKLEFNAEYRFKLIDLIEGAVFVDAGNIWLVKKDTEDKLNAVFDFNTFYKQIAIGTGVGLRVNLKVFVLRFDTAIQTYDPSLTKGERWVWESKTNYNNMIDEYNSNHYSDGSGNLDYYKPFININIGIGYPF